LLPLLYTAHCSILFDGISADIDCTDTWDMRMQGGPKIDLTFLTRSDLKWNKWIHSLIAYHYFINREAARIKNFKAKLSKADGLMQSL